MAGNYQTPKVQNASAGLDALSRVDGGNRAMTREEIAAVVDSLAAGDVARLKTRYGSVTRDVIDVPGVGGDAVAAATFGFSGEQHVLLVGVREDNVAEYDGPRLLWDGRDARLLQIEKVD